MKRGRSPAESEDRASPMNIYISTSDKGIHIVEAFQYLFNKYWGGQQPVTILGYAAPQFGLAPNFKFISLGQDKGPRVCGDLLDFFSDVENEHFIWSVDDQVIIRPLDWQLYELLGDTITADARVGRASLVGNVAEHEPPAHTTLQGYNGFDLIEQSQTDVYRLSAIWSIWRKEYFLKYLKPDMNLWEWETRDHANNDSWHILATSGRYAVTTAHIYVAGKLHPNSFKSWDKHKVEMVEADREAILPLVIGR